MRALGRVLSVRTRLTLWYGGVLLAIVLVISAFSYFMLRRTLIRGADVELQMVGQLVRDAGIGEARRSEAEVREILGPERRPDDSARDQHGASRAGAPVVRARGVRSSSGSLGYVRRLRRAETRLASMRMLLREVLDWLYYRVAGYI